jgi:hypothetical protein
MPYEIKKEDDKYCVYKQGGDKVACHDTREKAEGQIAAIEASEGETAKKAVTMNGMSFQAMLSLIEMAWYEKFKTGFIVEVYEKHLIARKDGEMWKVPYTRSGETVEITDFTEWEKVRLDVNFVSKNFAKLRTIKSLGEDRVGGYAILFGNRSKRDLHKEFFTEDTDEVDAIFKGMGAVPFIYNHGVDGVMKAVPVGKVDVLEKDNLGWWFEAQITQHERYKQMVAPLLEEEALYPSSGVLPAAKKSVKSTGQIVRWPVIEVTGTTTPAEHRMLNIPIAELNKMYKAVGLDDVLEETPPEPEVSEKDKVELALNERRIKNRLAKINS